MVGSRAYGQLVPETNRRNCLRVLILKEKRYKNHYILSIPQIASLACQTDLID